jgi:hypothetical protein
MDFITVAITCPYCGHLNIDRVWATDLGRDSGKHFFRCDVEEGGCDQTFVADIQFEPVVTTYILNEAKCPEAQ